MDIEFKNFKKYYGTQKVVDIENLYLDGGKIYCLKGKNGVGKTTLLRTIANLDCDYNGMINFYQKGCLCTETQKHVTMVFQKPYIFNMTVRENVAYGLKTRKFPKAEMEYKIDKCLTQMDLKKYSTKNALKLSGGEMQRLALARAIVFEPLIMLLDEPTSNADEEYKQLMNKIILNMNQKNKTTIIMVTHDSSQLHKIGGILLSMENGKVILQN